MKKIAVLLLILMLGVFAVSIGKDLIIKGAIESIVSIATGLRIDIGELKTSIVNSSIDIRDMTVLNPPRFEDKIMLYIPEIYIDYDLSALLKKEIHLKDVRIDLKQFTVIKDKRGETNLDHIKNLKKKGGKTAKGGTGERPLQIDNLKLKIGKVIYKDYSLGEKPVITEYNINLDSRYRNVQNASEIMGIIVARALINTTIGTLSDFRKFKDTTAGTLETGKDILKRTADELKGILERPFKARK